MAKYQDFAEVLRRFTLRDVIRHYGHAPEHDHKWKSFPHCPFCKNKGCAGVFAPKGGTDGIELFKCHHRDCSSNPAVNAVGYVGQAGGLSMERASGEKLSPAAKEFLRIAGAWREPEATAESRKQKAESKQPTRESAVEVGEALDEGPDLTEESAGIWAETEEVPANSGEIPAENAVKTGGEKGDAVESVPTGQVAVAVDSVPAGEPSADAPAPVPAEVAPAAEPNGAETQAEVVPEAEEPTRGLLVLTALREFHEAMPFIPEHVEQCRVKRGLTEDTCRQAGLRSSIPANRAALEKLRIKYPMSVLSEAGLFVKDKKSADGWKPNPKFCGWGVAGVKPKAERRHADDKRLYGMVNPIVIPYYNTQGVIVALRPHKDSVEGDIARVYEPGNCLVAKAESRKQKAEAESADRESAPAPKASLGLLTEGEFKALAWWQVTGRPVLALPGIQQVRNLWPDIEAWLETRLEPRALAAVVFDNEVKDDPKLPGFQPDAWKRYDAPKWGLYLARLIARAGYDGRFGVLPDAWRDAKGKADWDGALALLQKQKAESGKQKLDLEKLFVNVALEALPEKDFGQADLFESESRREILNGVAKLDYQWKLKSGAEAETALANRITRFCARRRDDEESLPGRWRGLLQGLAQRYRSVAGRYYICKQLTDRPRALLEAEQARAKRNGDDEYLRMLALLLDVGLPEPVSNFTVQWHYTVIRSTGIRDRLVSLKNVHGETTSMVLLPAKPFSRPSDWRQWLLENGGFSWSCGEKELQALIEDGCRMTAYKTVQEVASLGYHEASKLWFFGDCAFGPDGEVHEPDRHGIYWIQSTAATQGYTLRRDPLGRLRCGENQEFVQGVPMMRPRKAAGDSLNDFWAEMQFKLHESVGGPDANIVLGMICSYAAMPELYARWNATPGLWIPGEQSSGKSSLARWLIRIWGFTSESGRPLPGSTSAKIRAALQQYSNLPLWLEEYQPGCEPWKHEILKNILDRSPSMKIDAGDRQRDILTSVLVTGVATCPDAQVKSRYAHVQMSARRRLADHYRWFEENSHRFYQFGRHLLQRRQEYVKHFLELLAEWVDGEPMRKADARARLVHGVAYAGFVAAARLFNSMTDTGVASFRAYTEAYTRGASKETSEAVNVNQFWMDVVSAAQQGAFGLTGGEMRRFFKWSEKSVTHPPEDRILEAPGATLEVQAKEWKSAQLYFVPQLVIEALKAHQRKHGSAVAALDRNDLMAQMKVKPYWNWARSKDGSLLNNGHRQRFAGKQSAQACWCINVDYHELGFVPCSDETYLRGLFIDGDPDQGWLSEDKQDDPRRGDLYVLGELLKRKSEGEQE